MTQRIFISPSRVTVSRPGYDAVNPPAFNTDYLAVDSSFPQPARVAVSGVVYGASIITFPRVSYGTTFSDYPYVQVLAVEPNSGYSILRNLYMKWVGGNPDTYANPYQTQIGLSDFLIGVSLNDSTSSGYNSIVRDWIYVVFAP